MPYPGLFLAVCALFLAADGLASPAQAPAPAPEPKCRFTLERGMVPAADDAAETWVLTCHRAAEPEAPATAALRRVEPAPAETSVGF